MHLWGAVDRTLLPLAHIALGFTVFQLTFLESWLYAFQEYVGNCQQAGELWGFFWFVYLFAGSNSYWMRALGWQAILVCMLASLLALDYYQRFSLDVLEYPKIPLQWLIQSLCCHFFIFLSNLTCIKIVSFWPCPLCKTFYAFITSGPGSFLFLGSCCHFFLFAKKLEGVDLASQALSGDFSV